MTQDDVTKKIEGVIQALKVEWEMTNQTKFLELTTAQQEILVNLNDALEIYKEEYEPV